PRTGSRASLRVPPEGSRGARRGGSPHRRPDPDHRLHSHPTHLMAINQSDPTHGESRLLESIHSPVDLHRLSDQQLQQVAQEPRELITDVIGGIGGHFGANLGPCELAVALHSLLDSPRDKILWDVGHQAYPHKVLTGRRDRLATIRQYEG